MNDYWLFLLIQAIIIPQRLEDDELKYAAVKNPFFFLT